MPTLVIKKPPIRVDMNKKITMCDACGSVGYCGRHKTTATFCSCGKLGVQPAAGWVWLYIVKNIG